MSEDLIKQNLVEIEEITYHDLVPISEITTRRFDTINRDHIRAKEKWQAEEDRNIFRAINSRIIKTQNQELFRKYVRDNSVCILS